MPQPAVDFRAILEALTARRVEFILVGGVGAALHGSPRQTFDVDVVQARDPANAERLMLALVDLDACHREHLPRRLAPRLQDLVLPGHHLLMTRFGPLDVLGTIGKGRGFEELRANATRVDLGRQLAVSVLDLETMIRIKEELGREKDLAGLPELRRLLEERRHAR
jgi:hypothetical protein